MTNHELNILAARAMGWRRMPNSEVLQTIRHTSDNWFVWGGGYPLGARGVFIALTRDKCIPKAWNPCQNLNQAWELYTHVHPLTLSCHEQENQERDDFFYLAWGGKSSSPVWRSAEDFARALTEASIETPSS
jgi:hypothetical protein